MRTVTTTFPVAKYRALRKGKCPVCGMTVNRSRVFQKTENPYNVRADGTPRTLIEVLAQAAAEAETWEPDFTHSRCREVTE